MYLAMEKVTFVKMVRGKNGNACGISEERKEKRKSMCLFGVYMLEVVYQLQHHSFIRSSYHVYSYSIN